MSASQGGTSQRSANQTTLFPEPAIEKGKEKGDNQGSLHGEGEGSHTFSVYPQEGVSGFSLAEYIALKKPSSCVVMMCFACNVMID
jgi:hypothetical protein